MKLTLGERVAKVEQKVDDLCHLVKNHLKHHWAIELLLLTIILGWVAKQLLK